MERLRRTEDALVALERWLLTGLLAFMVGLSFLQVVLRQASLQGWTTLSILWGDTLLRHLVLWVGFLGAGVAAAQDKQFAMDLSARLFSGRAKHAVALLCHAFTVAVCAGLTRASWAFFREEYAHGSALFSLGGRQVPAWTLETVIPGGFALLLLHYLLKLVEAASGLRRPDAPGREARPA